MTELNLNYELIVVNDGSKNDFEKINNHAVAEGCRLISYKKNKGKGFAVKKGVEAAEGNVIIYMDGDFPFEFGIIGTSINIFFSNDADVVIGDRTNGASINKSKASRKIGSNIVSKFANLFLVKNIPDTQCGFKAFKKNVAKKLFSLLTISGYSFDIQILYLAQRFNFKIFSIPVVVNKQAGSNVKLIWHGLQIIIDIFKIRLKKKLYSK